MKSAKCHRILEKSWQLATIATGPYQRQVSAAQVYRVSAAQCYRAMRSQRFKVEVHASDSESGNEGVHVPKPVIRRRSMVAATCMGISSKEYRRIEFVSAQCQLYEFTDCPLSLSSGTFALSLFHFLQRPSLIFPGAS